MPESKGPYPPVFRQQMVELVRAGRSPEALAKEFEPSGQTVRNWVIQAERDEGCATTGRVARSRRGDYNPSPSDLSEKLDLHQTGSPNTPAQISM